MINHNTGPIALGPPTGGYPIVATRPPGAGPISAPPTGWPAATGPIPVSGAVTGPLQTGQTGPIPISGPPRPVSPAIPVSPAPGSVPARASAALRMAAATLDASEAELVDVNKQTSGDRLWTNFLVYGGFTLVAILIQLPILLYGGGVATAVALPFGVVAPIIAFGLGWLVAGAVAPKGSSRNPGMGVGISLLALLPVVVLIGMFFVR
jgi:hypothetical protein